MEQSKNDDNSVINMNGNRMKELKIFNGDPVLIRGKRRKTTVCVAVRDNTLPENKMGLNKVSRKNIRVKMGDLANVYTIEKFPNLKKIHILPFADTIEGITGDLTQTYLAPYFKNANRPLSKGDIFTVRKNFRPVDFKVIAVEPGVYGTVASNTLLFTEGDPIDR